LVEIANAMHISLQGVNVDKVGDDDTHPFLAKKYRSSLFIPSPKRNGRSCTVKRDNVSAIDSADYYDAYRLVSFDSDYLDTRLSSETMPTASH